MKLTDEQRNTMISLHLRKANIMLAEADEMLQLQHIDLAANRYYYACFHAVHALFVKNGISAKTHEGTISMFGKEFILTGRFDKRYGTFLTHMEQLRQKADYNCVYDITTDELTSIQKPAHELVDTIVMMLTT